MRLVEYEVKIKELVKKNRKDPEIYNYLQKMIEMFLRRKKVCKSQKDYEDMSYLLAGDIFMKIIEGEEISYYLGYLEKIYRKYAQDYYRENSSYEILHIDDISDLENFSSPKSYEEYDTTIDKLYLKDIGKIIDDVMYSSCKYDPVSPAFINLKLSLVLSIIRDEDIHFHLTPEQEFYLKLIKTNFFSKIIKDMKD